jgi:hypothetical protein
MWCCLRNLTKCLQLSYLLAISKVTLLIHMVVQLLPCLSFLARALGSHRGNYGDHEVHSVYWQCISMLYFRSFPQGCYKTYEPHLVGLITDGSTGGFFSFRACRNIMQYELLFAKRLPFWTVKAVSPSGYYATFPYIIIWL